MALLPLPYPNQATIPFLLLPTVALSDLYLVVAASREKAAHLGAGTRQQAATRPCILGRSSPCSRRMTRWRRVAVGGSSQQRKARPVSCSMRRMMRLCLYPDSFYSQCYAAYTQLRSVWAFCTLWRISGCLIRRVNGFLTTVYFSCNTAHGWLYSAGQI